MLEIKTVVYEPATVDNLLLFTTEESITEEKWPSAEISELVQAAALEGKFGEVAAFNFWRQGKPQRVLVAGLGKKEELDLEKIRRAFGKALAETEKLKIANLTVAPWIWKTPQPREASRALVEAAILATYRFNRYLAEKKEASLRSLQLAACKGEETEVGQGAQLGQTLARATCLARDLVNEPANTMTPAQLGQEAQKAGQEYGFEVEVLEEQAISHLKMQAFLEVSKATTNRPRLIIMRHLGDPQNPEDILGLVGKGLTYDSGGLSIKSGESMPTMKYDMAGSAAVIGAMSAIAHEKLAVNVVAVIAACENLISGSGYRPGDVIGSMAGKSILINSTDAEGRLTLADAVHYIISEENVNTVVDVATLTGAAIIALGNTTTAVLTNDGTLYAKLELAANQSGERVWQLPSFPEYREQNKTPLADLANTGGRGAGTITAGLFIEEFVQEKPWIHLDIAGTAFTSKNLDYIAEGATGVGVRLLYHFVEGFL